MAAIKRFASLVLSFVARFRRRRSVPAHSVMSWLNEREMCSLRVTGWIPGWINQGESGQMMDALRMSESSGGLVVSMSPASVRRSQSRLQLLAGLLLDRISGQLTSDGLHITKRGVLQMRHMLRRSRSKSIQFTEDERPRAFESQ